MNARILYVGAALCLVSAAGCSKDEGHAPASNPPPTIAATPSPVVADGAQSTTISITAGTPPVTLTTTRGLFGNGSTTITVASVPGTAVLSPCNAHVTATCAGPAVVTAVGADGQGTQISVTFQGFENCSNHVDDTGDGLVDCADPQCPLDSPCGANGLLCSSTGQCNKCTGNGGTPEVSRETTCTDGFDNDCDGKVDCADEDCANVTCTTVTNAAGVCKDGACVCDKTEATETSCGDGKDNDCDNLVDCADPDCVGRTCDATTGLVCAGVTPFTCRVCPTGQTTETQCGDGKDNDCDGKIDCFDPDCQPAGGAPGQPCNPFGGTCIVTQGVPSCGCPTGATTETSCSGGVDDDCDGLVDCADPDCQPSASGFAGPACDALGRQCTSTGACACPGGDKEICNNYDAAGNPIDDDCDGRANCADRDCRPTTPGGTGEDCSGLDQVGMACDATGACACTGNGGTPEATETTCDDGFDNDCDYLVDCQDPNCASRPCGPGGATCNGATLRCVCPGGSVETSCSNGLDDNCNGLVDCEEPSCAAQACNTAFPTYTCRSGSCTDPATLYSVTVTPVRARIPANGTATTVVNVVVTKDGVTQPSEPVAFSLSDASLGSIVASTARTDGLGRAQLTFRSAGPTGVETITATLSNGASGSATVTMPAIGEIRLRENGILYPVMGVKTSGFREQNEFTIEVLDPERQTYPDGLDIVFEHQPLGGSTLADPLASPACRATPCVQAVAATVPGGTSSGRLYSGTVAGVVRVSATAVAGGVTHYFEMPTIAIVGAKANAGHFSVICDPRNQPAYAGSTCHVSLMDTPFTCVAFLKDRYNNLLGRATTVSFMSEAGAVGPPAVTPEYDPTKDAASQGDLGTAVEIVNTLGAKLPKDVPANPGEQAITMPADVCGTTQRNPRDGVVTVVAWTTGEEAFFDSNGNGTYDLGEPFVDLPEPFVDYDDDDVRDADEPFIDTNGNGAFDGPNGVWDSSTNVWTRTVVLYSGVPETYTAGGREYASRWMNFEDAGTYAGPTPTATFAVRPFIPADTFYDCNDNKFRDTNVMEPYSDVNSNGAYDVGEPFADCNQNGVRDPTPVAEYYTDLDGNGVYDTLSSPPTSDKLVVAVSDRNLNALTRDAIYSLEMPAGFHFTANQLADQELPDRLGFRFSFQPCLASAPTTCALDCADISTPTSARCVMRTRVADFGYGNQWPVTFWGDKDGNADLNPYLDFRVEIPKLVIFHMPIWGTHQ